MFYGSSMAYDKVRGSALPATSACSSVAAEAWSLPAVQAMRGDEPLSTVLLRNVFLGDPARKQDAGALARYVQWCAVLCRPAPLLQPLSPMGTFMLPRLCRHTPCLCRELACLAKTESEHVLHGKIRFSSEFEAVKDDGAQ